MPLRSSPLYTQGVKGTYGIGNNYADSWSNISHHVANLQRVSDMRGRRFFRSKLLGHSYGRRVGDDVGAIHELPLLLHYGIKTD